MKQPAIIRDKENSNAALKAGRNRNRAQKVSEVIKDWILELRLFPGDRLPQEPELIAKLGVSKGTLRESLKILETQGLIKTRTGPGGGAFISEMEKGLANSLLATHFFFKDVSISDIYELRIIMEPQLARNVCGYINETQIEILREKMTYYNYPPVSIVEEQSQREKELEFHEIMAGFCQNELLRFNCQFLVQLLKELIICKKIYQKPNPELREKGLTYQEQLLTAFTNKDSETAHLVLQAHMLEAKSLMLAQEAHFKRGFLKG